MKQVNPLSLLMIVAVTAVAALFLPLDACHAFGHRAPVSIPAEEPIIDDGKPDPDASPAPVALPEPVGAISTPQLSISEVSGATEQEDEVISEGLVLANQVMARNCFKQWVLAAHYTENLNLSQDQIWSRLATVPISVKVEMYTGTWWANHKLRTVGYENEPYDGVVHMNRYFVKTAQDVADNLTHEGEGHSQGFSHYQVKATSQPYGMNYAFEGCTAPQAQQRAGGKPYRPPGLRLEIRRQHRSFPAWHRQRCQDAQGRKISGCHQ